MNNNTSTIENVADQVFPLMTKGIILIGIIMVLLGITIVLYSLITKKMTRKNIGQYLLYTAGGGVLACMSGLTVYFLFNYEFDFTSYRYSIPVGYILSLSIFLLLINANNINK